MLVASFDRVSRYTRWVDFCGTKVLTVRTFVRVVRRECMARLFNKLHTPGLAKLGECPGRYVDSEVKTADCTPFALFVRLMHQWLQRDGSGRGWSDGSLNAWGLFGEEDELAYQTRELGGRVD